MIARATSPASATKSLLTFCDTCATWMLQNGVSTREVAGYLGTSEKVIEKTDGHHSPDHMLNARRAFRGRNLGGAK